MTTSEASLGAPAVQNVPLRQGVALPQIGLGVFRAASGLETQRAVASALALGYRHIDTARVYGNEADVGAAVRDSGLARGDVFVTTKVWNDDQGYDATLRAAEASSRRLELGYIDLLLLHWPVPGLRLESWRALERLRAEGVARAIGVSNFMPHHLRELLGRCDEPPSVNQVEVSPFLQQSEVRALCAEHGIVVEAYSPLTKGRRLDHPIVSGVALRNGLTPAQALLGWALAHQLVVLPKSTNPLRQAENLASAGAMLGPEDVAELDALDEGLVTGWDPRAVP